MSSVQTSTSFRHARDVRTRATGTIIDINDGAEFARKVIEMLGTVFELLSKIAIFPTKLTTQKQQLEAEQQRTAATVLKIQDDVRTALDQPNPTKEKLEKVMKLAEEQGNKQLPVMSEENIDMFKFHAQIHNPPEECLVRGLLDTGADDSWISAEALRRAKLTGHVKPLRKQREFKGFGGNGVQATQEVTVEWYISATAVRESRFFVLEDLADDELDMIVGKNDILRYNLVVLKRAAFVIRSLKKKGEKKKDRKNAQDHEQQNDVLAEQQRQQEMKELEDRLEKLRAENPCTGPSPSTPSTNPTQPNRRPPPPPVPAKSAEAIAIATQYKERKRTQSSPVVTVDTPEGTSPPPSLRPTERDSQSSSMSLPSTPSIRSNPTTDSTTTPRSSLSNGNSFQRFIPKFRRQSDDDQNQEQRAGASNHGSGPSRFLPSRWRNGQDSDERTPQLL